MEDGLAQEMMLTESITYDPTIELSNSGSGAGIIGFILFPE